MSLLEDLDHEAHLAERAGATSRAARLREHASRLRAEMERAGSMINASLRAKNSNAAATWYIVDKSLREVNGGPVK